MTAVLLVVGIAILLGSILGLRFPMGRQSNNQISPSPTATSTPGTTIAPATVPTVSGTGTPFPSPYPSATPTATPVPNQAPTPIDPSEPAPPVNALW